MVMSCTCLLGQRYQAVLNIVYLPGSLALLSKLDLSSNMLSGFLPAGIIRLPLSATHSPPFLRPSKASSLNALLQCLASAEGHIHMDRYASQLDLKMERHQVEPSLLWQQ